MKNIFLAIMLMILLTACHQKIEEVINNPEQYNQQEVSLRGEVVLVSDLAVIKFYKLRDSTGEIHVFTDKLPPKGEIKTVNGTVNKAFEFMDQKLVVINEKTEK